MQKAAEPLTRFGGSNQNKHKWIEALTSVSDWLLSTCHFCLQMQAIHSPGTSNFLTEQWLATFRGRIPWVLIKSVEMLFHTVLKPACILESLSRF